jgi:hypothetical protein
VVRQHFACFRREKTARVIPVPATGHGNHDPRGTTAWRLIIRGTHGFVERRIVRASRFESSLG